MIRNFLSLLVMVTVFAAAFWFLTDDRERQPDGGPVETTGAFPMETDGLPEAKPMETVELRNDAVYDLVIAPARTVVDGRPVRVLAYNGMFPGPLFRVRQGDSVTVRLRNQGDLETTLHPHGLRLDNRSDGIPGITQAPVKVGESYEYRLTFPDAGMFWYHPHVRTDYTIEAGLYGAILVEPKENDYWSPAHREEALILDDIAIDAGGLEEFDRDQTSHALMGRYGTVMLVNGTRTYRLDAKAGEVIRFGILNAANTRPFQVAFTGARMKLVGADMGRYEQESFVESVILGPGERRMVEVLFDRPGTYALEHRTPGRTYPLGEVRTGTGTAEPAYAASFASLRQNRTVTAEMGSLAPYLTREPDKRLTLSMTMGAGGGMGMMGGHGSMGGMHQMPDGSMMMNADMGMGDDGDAIEWEDTMLSMNAGMTNRSMVWQMKDDATGQVNMDIADWKFTQGSLVKVRIFNDPRSMHPMQHPIHFHGQRFAVLATNGIENHNRVWQDTALIPKGDTVDMVVEMSNPGDWMAHCHIAEHAESGMMLPFSVK